jgi:hypothetical protein
MALADYIQRTRNILTGYGLGEKPIILQVAADAVNTVSGDTVAITLLDGTNSGKVRAGDVLSTYNPATEAAAWAGYVLGVSGSVVTCVNGYEGTTAIANAATTHDGSLLYLHGEGAPTDHTIANAIQVVENTLLWPHIYKVEFDTEANPSLTTGRVDLDAEVEDLEEAWQFISTERYSIPFKVEKSAPSEADNSTAGVVAEFGLVDGSTLYLKTLRRMVVGTDEATYPQLVEVVSLGAAAIAAGFSRPETTLATAKTDSRDRGRAPDVGQAMWRDFFAIRDSWADDMARERVDKIIVDRG